MALTRKACRHKKRSYAANDANKLDGEMKYMMTLRDVPVGKTVHVVKIHGEGNLRRRVMDMGITKNVEIYLRKVAPLGDPIEINVRGYELGLRKEEASIIEVC